MKSLQEHENDYLTKLRKEIELLDKMAIRLNITSLLLICYIIGYFCHFLVGYTWPLPVTFVGVGLIGFYWGTFIYYTKMIKNL